eukprot:15404013-Alexandrium_andersonii.AAC.1
MVSLMSLRPCVQRLSNILFERIYRISGCSTKEGPAPSHVNPRTCVFMCVRACVRACEDGRGAGQEGRREGGQ